MDDNFLFYDRITDTIMYLSDSIMLEFIVVLGYKKKDNTKAFFHSEWEKISSYRLEDVSRTIRRRPKRFYYSLTVRDSFDASIALKPEDVYILNKTIDDKVLPWFFGNTRIFDIIEDKLIIKGEYKPYIYPQSEYKYLTIVPVVLDMGNGQYKEGVRMYLSSKNIFCDITIDTFLGFIFILKNTDMYNLCSSMMNYVKMAPYGINMGKATNGLGSNRLTGEESHYREIDMNTGESRDAKSRSNSFLDNSKTK